MNTEDPIPYPTKLEHQRFADYYLSGDRPAVAYRKAGFAANSIDSQAVGASRLLKNAQVRRYIDYVRAQTAKGMVLSHQAKREFLCRVVKVPLMAIDPHDPDHKDGDLLASYSRSDTEAGSTERRVKLCPLKAITIDNQLSGEDEAANATSALAAALAAMGPKTAEDESM